MTWRWCISWWRRTSSATWRGLPRTRASSSSYWPCWTRMMPTFTAKSVTTSWRSTSKCSSQCCRNILILVHTLHITFFHVIFSVCIITLKCVLLKLPNKWYLRTSITRVKMQFMNILIHFIYLFVLGQKFRFLGLEKCNEACSFENNF